MLSSLKNLDWYRFLARPQLPSPPEHLLDALNQQPILITGAGGSIGSALALRLRKIGPPKLVLLEASESNLYALERDCATAGATKPIVPILGSTADEALLEEIFVTHAPRLVFHTAAFKHVPLMEAQPLAAIANNIFATETVTKVAAAHGARVVLLSTDKAVAPASIMGATKRVAEQIVLTGGGIALRLGNVLASHDSVTEIFARQIERDGPITVTDPAARRYFLTLDEAVDLLLTAAGRREPSALLAPVLPTAHFIADLARFMVHELAPDREIAIEFAGSRPGDKESEKLWSAGDRISAASLEGMVVVESALLSEAQRNGLLASLQAALDVRDLAAALAHLRALVPDYTPTRTVLTLASQCRPRVCL